MCRFSKIITANFPFFKKYGTLFPKGVDTPMAEKKTTTKKTTTKKTTSTTKKLSVTLDKETYALLEEYIAEFELGYLTDTLDNTGNILNTSDKVVNYSIIKRK